jgi:hypothetical protein
VPKDWVQVAKWHEILSSREYAWDGGSTSVFSYRLSLSSCGMISWCIRRVFNDNTKHLTYTDSTRDHQLNCRKKLIISDCSPWLFWFVIRFD